MAQDPDKPQDKQTGDPRVSGIATVGWVTLSALALCVPLTLMVGRLSPLLAGALPLTLIIGAGLMSVRIWSSGEKLVNQRENEALKARIEELEERLTNLEMIDSLEAHFAEKHRAPGADGSGNTAMGPPREESESAN